MVSVLVEPIYARSIWGQNLTEGLIAQLKLKRIAYQQVSAISEIGPESRYMFLIGSDSIWVEATMEAAEQQHIYPILISTQGYHRFNARHSAVCSDVMSSMRHLVNWLHSHQCRRIGLYGVNPESLNDLSLLQGYQAAIGFAPTHIYYNNSSLAQCYGELAQQADPPDALICTNGFAAISLVRRLRTEQPEYLKRLTIISCQKSALADSYAEHILSVRHNSAEYGKGGVLLYENLRKADYLSHMLMLVNWDMSELEAASLCSIKAVPPQDVPVILEPAASFYQDRELNDMMVLEMLLHDLAAEDRAILRSLIAGQSLAVIADNAFMTLSTVKYRIKRMVAVSGLKDKAHLLALIQQYIPSFH